MSNIEIVDLDRQFKEDYLDYGMYVIKERALPDVRDGLKPVQRRVLYVLHESGLYPNKPYQKSARVVGNVMGKYHPHGDSGIYDSVKTMARWWRSQLPYVNGKGNFGNIQGNDAAAMRYTEIRLSPFGEMLTERLDNGSTNYVKNYDESELEPEVLPISYPTLLINGNFGIAVGMTSNCLPHNPIEVMDATIEYIRNPKIKLEDLMKILPGPDFPSGGVLLDSDRVSQYYETGELSITVRGKTHIEGNKVIITEVPWTLSGSSESLKDDIYKFIDDKKSRNHIRNARTVEDYSNKDGIRIEVTAKNKDNVKNLERELYAKTRLTSRISASFLVVHEGAPKLMGLLEYLDIYVNNQHRMVIKESRKLKEKSEKRLMIVDGLIKANEVIDVIIEVIRNSKNPTAIKNCLMEGDISGVSIRTKKNQKIASSFNFTDEQADAILLMQLRRLSNLDQDLLTKEKKSLEEEIDKQNGFIQSKTKRKNLIIKQHESIKERLLKVDTFDRKTKLSNKSYEEYEEEVSSEPISIRIDRFGYIKTTSPSADTQDLDVYMYDTVSTDEVGIFASNAKFYKIKADELKLGSTRGVSVAGVVGLPTSDYLLLNQVGDPILFSETEGYQLFVTKNGLAKKVLRSEFPSTRKETIATRLKDGDGLIYAKNWADSDYIVFVSETGLVKKVSSDDIREYGKNSQGTITSAPPADDVIVSVYQVNDKDTIEVMGKTVKVRDIPLQKTSHTMKKI